MNRIATATGKRIGFLGVDLSDNEESAIFPLLITPGSVLGSGYRLTATADDDAVVLARETDSGDPFTDIEASPIDLTVYPENDPVSFDIKIVSSAPLIDTRRAVLEIILTNA